MSDPMTDIPAQILTLATKFIRKALGLDPEADDSGLAVTIIMRFPENAEAWFMSSDDPDLNDVAEIMKRRQAEREQEHKGALQ